MELKYTGLWWVAVESPVEFVIIGPKGRKNGVIIRSGDMKPDLLGMAIQDADTSVDRDSNDVVREHLDEAVTRVVDAAGFSAIGSLFGVRNISLRRLHVITSIKTAQMGEDDNRVSSYRFAWVGYASREAVLRITQQFNEHLVEMQSSIKENDSEQLEWHLTPVLYACMKANARYLETGRFGQAYLGALMVLGIGIGLISAAVYVAQHLVWKP